jgi:hypothetical protein
MARAELEDVGEHGDLDSSATDLPPAATTRSAYWETPAGAATDPRRSAPATPYRRSRSARAAWSSPTVRYSRRNATATARGPSRWSPDAAPGLPSRGSPGAAARRSSRDLPDAPGTCPTPPPGARPGSRLASPPVHRRA